MSVCTSCSHIQVLVAIILSLILRTFHAMLHKAYNITLFTVPATSTISWAVSVSEVNLGQTFTLALSEEIV